MQKKITTYHFPKQSTRLFFDRTVRCCGYFCFFIVLITITSCRKAYQPAAITASNQFLTVEGVINTGTAAVTTIRLSRTRSLGDTAVSTLVENGAQVLIETESGGSFSLSAQGNGVYQTTTLSLNPTLRYRLKINTNNGGVYQSAFVSTKQSPPIDSVTWNREKDLSLYVHTHDPQNKTIYYRWEFDETWQYRAAYQTSLGVKNRVIFYLDSITQTYNCWGMEHSKNILTASTAVLSKDQVSYMPLQVIADSTEKAGVRYSINVLQYALTEEAYNYWEILKRNTQNTGTIFDAQPSQLSSNISCISNPAEPVIGFVSAGSVAEKRIFIDNSQLSNWVYISQSSKDCIQTTGQQDPNNYLHFIYPDTSFSPYYFITPGTLAIVKTACLDCTRRGGTNIKPLFW